MHDPVFDYLLVEADDTTPKINCEAISKSIVVQKVVFYNTPLIPEGDNELFEIMISVMLHDVPENRFSPNLNHRFGSDIGLFRQSSSQASSQYHNFHAKFLRW